LRLRLHLRVRADLLLRLLSRLLLRLHLGSIARLIARLIPRLIPRLVACLICGRSCLRQRRAGRHGQCNGRGGQGPHERVACFHGAAPSIVSSHRSTNVADALSSLPRDVDPRSRRRLRRPLNPQLPLTGPSLPGPAPGPGP
jgi:hypothetical protein